MKITCVSKAAVDSPGGCKLNVSVKKPSHLATGNLPALDTCTDKPLPPLVPHDFHEAWVTLVHVVFQWAFQLLCDDT